MPLRRAKLSYSIFPFSTTGINPSPSGLLTRNDSVSVVGFEKFQFLIGRLKTDDYILCVLFKKEEFQFLIGRLKTTKEREV
ncbi:hypothetical protein, partial [Acetomicrobium sp. S15 = DSM 107314]|uniref:hypothetical protein n=1 Tax=Acetomicrobium sp. S15 = DSM 107314 TaxID=2529858 RepID=UPI001E44A9E6